MATRTVPQPPFTPELLADLHAGNVTAAQHERLWPIVSRDQQAVRYLRGLDEVSAELGALGRDEHIIHAMPEEVTARLTEFVDTLRPSDDVAQNATVHLPARVRDGEFPCDPEVSESGTLPSVAVDVHRTRARWFAAAAAAIVAVIAAGSVISTLDGRDDPAPIARSTIGNDGLTATMALGALGRHTVTGSLADPEALRRCVHANGLDRAVLGAADIAFHGRDAVLILLNGPQPPAITALVVGTGCTTDDPQRRVLQDIG
ncbi:hypothetical protein [Nocardia araoensis]|uniref:hypothetical protein n=1 Tax=Nocardia araoensis TaxID=228600 RepID=UPI0012F6D4E7|nr:hypothetical protein [Nocardia araoensis]